MCKIVLGWKKEFLFCCQWMVVGPSGQSGPTAPWAVGRGCRFELVPASTPLHETMGPTAVGQREKYSIVTHLPVSVCMQCNYVHLPFITATDTYYLFLLCSVCIMLNKEIVSKPRLWSAFSICSDWTPCLQMTFVPGHHGHSVLGAAGQDLWRGTGCACVRRETMRRVPLR